MIDRNTAIVICVSIVAFVVAAAMRVEREVIVAIAAAAVTIAGAMGKLYDRNRKGAKDGDA